MGYVSFREGMNHWFPLSKAFLNPYFTKGGYVKGKGKVYRFTSHDSWDLKIQPLASWPMRTQNIPWLTTKIQNLVGFYVVLKLGAS